MNWLELIKQDQTWITRDGREVAVADMTPGHCANLLPMLRRVAWRLQLADQLRVTSLVCASVPTITYPDGSSAPWLSDAQEDLMNWVDDEPVDDWFERQPLVRALRARADQPVTA